MIKKIKKRKGGKVLSSSSLFILLGMFFFIFFFVYSNFYNNKTKQNTIYTSENNTHTTSQQIKVSDNKICKDAEYSAYTVKNLYNNFTVCYPKNWNIKNSGAKNYENNIVITSPDDKELVYSVKSLIYDPNLSDPHTFQFTNIPFEQAVKKELTGSNSQFKVDRYTTTNKTPEINGVEYSYKVYEYIENTTVVWFIKSTKRKNTYYSIKYGYDQTFSQESVQNGKKILLSLIENFSDSP